MSKSASTRITQRDLARMAGLSHTTISLALRGHPSIPERTRRKIEILAQRHHYRPDPALAALNAYRVGKTRTRFQGTLAWVTSFNTASAWRDMVQAEGYFSGAQKRAEHLGYQVEEFWIAEPRLTAKRATQILLSRGVRGLIIAPLPAPGGRLDLDWKHFSAVALGYSLAEPQLHVVMNHQFRNMKHVMQHLTRLRYRRIGFAMPSANDERVDHSYLGGYVVAQRDLPSSFARIPPLLVDDFNSDTFLAWFRAEHPDVVIVAAAWARRIVQWLKIEGVKVPGDVGLAVASVPFGDDAISGVDENVLMVGGMAVDTVVGMIHRHEQGPPLHPWRILAEGSWHAGTTVRQS